VVVQRCEGERLTAESADRFRIAREGARQQLERDFPIEASVAREVDFPHSARAELRDDLMWAKMGAWGELHLGVNVAHPSQRVACAPAGIVRRDDSWLW